MPRTPHLQAIAAILRVLRPRACVAQTGRSALSADSFPLTKIIEDYRGHSKDLLFDDDFISGLLKTQKDDASCFSILALLMPDLDYTRALQKDHIHPAASFGPEKIAQYEFLKGKQDAMEFFQNRENWNSIVNLHLLDESRNKSKQDRPFADWFMEQEGLSTDGLLIPADAPLDFALFRTFVEKRTVLLSNILKGMGKT